MRDKVTVRLTAWNNVADPVARRVAGQEQRRGGGRV